MLPLLQRQGLDAHLTTLDSADFAFSGKGPEGPVEIGIERKTIGDLMSSLMSGRLQGMQSESGGGQLGRLVDAYDYVWLLVEGAVGVSRWGSVKTKHQGGGMTEDAITKRLLSLEMLGGVRVRHTTSPKQSAAFIASLARWWGDKEWSEHHTLHTTHKREAPFKLTRFREIVMTLPGIGLATSKAVEAHCNGRLPCLLSMTPETWAGLDAGGKRLGMSRAMQVVEAIRLLGGNA